MGIEYELYCKDCKEGHYLGKNASELAGAAVKGHDHVKKLWFKLVAYEKGDNWRLMRAKYVIAKKFSVAHTRKGHDVLVVER